MLYFNFTCPPLPHFIVAGSARYRQGDLHQKRQISEAFDLLFVTEGQLFMEESGRQHTLKPGDYLLLPPGTVHRGQRCCEDSAFFYWLHFYTIGEYERSNHPPKGEVFTSSPNRFYKKAPFYLTLEQSGQLHGLAYTAMEKYCKALCSLEINYFHGSRRHVDGAVSELQCQRTFLSIISLLCHQPKKAAPQLAEQVWHYLYENYQDEFSLEVLEQQFSFHRGHIIRSVKKQYGLTPLQLLLSIRIERAKQLLANTDLPIKKIGEQVGFINPAYFNRQFRRITGKSPGELRKRAEFPASANSL